MDVFSLVLKEHLSPGILIGMLIQQQVSATLLIFAQKKAPKAKRVNLLFIKNEKLCSHLDVGFLSIQ